VVVGVLRQTAEIGFGEGKFPRRLGDNRFVAREDCRRRFLLSQRHARPFA